MILQNNWQIEPYNNRQQFTNNNTVISICVLGPARVYTVISKMFITYITFYVWIIWMATIELRSRTNSSFWYMPWTKASWRSFQVKKQQRWYVFWNKNVVISLSSEIHFFSQLKKILYNVVFDLIYWLQKKFEMKE